MTLSGVFIVNLEYFSVSIVEFEHVFVCLGITVLQFRKIPRKTFVRCRNYSKNNLPRIFIKKFFEIFGAEAE